MRSTGWGVEKSEELVLDPLRNGDLPGEEWLSYFSDRHRILGWPLGILAGLSVFVAIPIIGLILGVPIIWLWGWLFGGLSLGDALGPDGTRILGFTLPAILVGWALLKTTIR